MARPLYVASNKTMLTMKKIFTSDLNVLIQLYAPEDYSVQIFDPYNKLENDEELNWFNGEAKKNLLISLGNEIQEYRGTQLSNFDVVFNFGKYVKHSHKFGRCFSFINDQEQKIRWYFPAGKVASVLLFYNNAGLRGKAISIAIKLAQFFNASSFLASGKFQVLSQQPLKVEALSEVASNETYSIFTGARSKQRTVLLALFQGKKVTDFIKIPISETSVEILTKEKEVLKKLSKTQTRTFAHGIDGSAHPLILRTNNLQKTKSKKTDKLTQQHIDTILELANEKQRITKIEDAAVWEGSLTNMWRMKQPESTAIRPIYKQLILLKHAINQEDLMLSSACHGDFTPWNIFHSKDGLALYDWELYSETASPLYDLFHFIYQRGILMRQESAQQIEKHLRNAFETFPELNNFLTQHKLNFTTCHQLYLLQTASYFGALYATNDLTIQHQWQIETWSEAIQSLVAEKATERATFILRLNEELQSVEHAYLKFNFETILNVPVSSDLDIALEKTNLDYILNFCKTEANAKISIRKKSFMTNVELFFNNNEFLSLDFIHDFKRKGNRMLNIKTVLGQSEMSSKGIRVPELKHDLEYTFLFYTLNNSNIPKKYWNLFNKEDLHLKSEAVFYLNEKYNLDFDNILELFSLNIKDTKAQLLKTLSNTKIGFPETLKLKVNYLLDTIKSAVNHPGFTITFSGVDGAGKSTIVELVKQELSEKYRKEVVQLRHRPRILPMLNSYKVGTKKAEELATVTLPRKGSNKSALSSLLRFSYYFADYILGQVYIYFKYLIRGKVVIYDRYYFDFISDPKRSNIQLNSNLVKALYSLILKPKLNFFLYAKSEVILKRKKELDAQTIDQLSGKYKGLFNELNKQERNSKYIVIENLELSETLDSVFSEFQKVA